VLFFASTSIAASCEVPLLAGNPQPGQAVVARLQLRLAQSAVDRCDVLVDMRYVRHAKDGHDPGFARQLPTGLSRISLSIR
jgi:hypothetical protein